MKLEIKNIVKKYDALVALDHISIQLENGIYGLLGPNGAGKSTLMNILSLLLKQEEGTILLDNEDIQKMGLNYLSKIGYMPQNCCLYEDFTLEENLYYVASLKGINKKGLKDTIIKLADEVELKDVLNKKISTFSGGMKQRAMFAQTLIGDPSILIMDEPTAGLDPQKRIELRNLIARLSRNRIVLIATHVVSDVEFIANQILLMKKGQLVAQGTPLELIESLENKVFEIETNEDALETLEKKWQISNLHYEKEKLMARIILHTPDHTLTSKSVIPNLNDVYLYYFGSTQ